jgi:hypothetical protein
MMFTWRATYTCDLKSHTADSMRRMNFSYTYCIYPNKIFSLLSSHTKSYVLRHITLSQQFVNVFPAHIDKNSLVRDLKEAIKVKKQNEFAGVDTDKFEL